jgi:hypothetical protein
MAKPEIEFKDYDTSYEWRPVEGDTFGFSVTIQIPEIIHAC